MLLLAIESNDSGHNSKRDLKKNTPLYTMSVDYYINHRAKDDYGPERPTNRAPVNGDNTRKDERKPPQSAQDSSSSQSNKSLSKEQDKKWLFFDNCLEINRSTGEVSPFCGATSDHYDPVDHVAILLGKSSISDEMQKEHKSTNKKNESVWRKRRRAAITEHSTHCDNAFSQVESVDDNGFIVHEDVPGASKNKSSQMWVSFSSMD